VTFFIGVLRVCKLCHTSELLHNFVISMDIISTKSGIIDSALEFRWKGTFLEVLDKESIESLSPRAFSDPGSHCQGEQIYFLAEKDYASRLPHRMCHSWASDEVENMTFPLCAKKKACMAEDSSDQEGTTCDDGVSQTQDSSSMCEFEVASARKHGYSTSLEMDQFPNQHGKVSQYRHHVKAYMQSNAGESDRTSRARHLSTALESIKEIPEQVAEALEEATTKAVDLIQNEVSVAQSMIIANEPGTNALAVQSLSSISDMILTSLELSVAKAVCDLRVKVHDMVERLPSFDEQDEEIVQQMLTIPQEVGQITRAAVKAASCSSQVHVVKQLDHILDISASEHIQEAVTQVQEDLIAKAQDAVDIQIDNATSIAKQNEQAAAAVNGVLADSLLRAKAAVTVQDGQVPHSLISSNPGTKGHPELCSRPCIYFALGKCTNGIDCAFCHGNHPSREAHLDKIHRSMLNSMDAPRRCNFILGVVVPKLVELEIGNQDAGNIIKLLAQETAIHDQRMMKTPEGRWKVLQRALNKMRIRSLLSLIRAPPDSTIHRLVSRLLNVLSQQSC